MKKLRVLPYKTGSNSARLIARVLDGLRVRFDGTFRPGPNHLVLNWGSPRKPRWWSRGLNDPDRVARAADKLRSLTRLKETDISIPMITTHQEEAQQWVNDGAVVVGRSVLNGHGGIGCHLFGRDAGPRQVQPFPLYTKHVRHKREFRIHVFKGQVIDRQEKLRERGVEDRNQWLRNHDNGYIFARQNIQVPEACDAEAIRAVQALALDFGAVDIAYREKENRAFVLEVNCAPGLEGTTVTNYAKAIKKELEA